MCESINSKEMTSFEVLPTQNGMPESFDSSEFSLIPEQPPLEEEGLVSHLSNASNVHSTFMSATEDLTAEEIKKRLVELVDDNESMKEALKYNNSMMKQQLNTISAWHNKMTTSISEQQMSLKEAKEKIDALEIENAELNKKLKELESKPKVDTEATLSNNSALSDEEVEYEIVQKKSKDEETLKQQLKVAEVRIAGLKQEMEKQSSEINSLKKHTKENEKEKSVLLSQMKEHEELKSKCVSLLIQVDEYEANMKQIQDLDEQKIKKLKAEVNGLKDQLGAKELAPVVEMASHLLLKQVDEYQSNMRAVKEMDDSLIKELETKVKDLEQKVILEQQASEAERVMHSETKKLFAGLQSNYDRVTKLLQIQSKDQKTKDEHMDSERELEARRNLEQIDSLTAKLFDTEQKLEEREEKVKEVTSELDTLKQDSESIPILKAQIEVYKIDLNNAVLARESSHEEVERLTKQLSEIQQASASFCANCGAGSAHAESRGGRGRRRIPGHGSRQSESHQRSDTELYVCPVCEFGFQDLQAAENHANNCIDKAQGNAQ